MDVYLLHKVNGLAGQYPVLDLAVVKFADLRSVSALPLVLCLVWLWYDKRTTVDRGNREIELATALAGMFLAVMVSRILQDFMPYSPRPINTPGLDLIRPMGLNKDYLREWSSFPSDHAAMSFAVATGIWRASRKLGAFAILWAALVTCLPRVFAGYHYPSDILAGASVGLASVAIAARTMPKVLPMMAALKSNAWAEPAFHTAMFAILFWTATMFDDIRTTASGIHSFARGKWQHSLANDPAAGRAQLAGGSGG